MVLGVDRSKVTIIKRVTARLKHKSPCEFRAFSCCVSLSLSLSSNPAGHGVVYVMDLTDNALRSIPQGESEGEE